MRLEATTNEKSVKTGRIINPDLVTSLYIVYVGLLHWEGHASSRIRIQIDILCMNCSSAVCFEENLVDMLIFYSLCSSVDE